MSLKEKIVIPKYSLAEELVNSISHGIGALLSIAALVLCVVVSAIHGNPIAVVASSIYGSTLIILYTMSTLYHSFKVNNAKRVFRIIDHCCIFLLISGTYTIFTLVVLGGAVGWTMFGIVWGATILGIIFNSIDINKFKKFSMLLYLAMGWVIIFAFKPLCEKLDPMGIVLLVAGGIAYTVGAIFYGVGKKKKFMHSVFHIFILIGSILQFFSVVLYAI